MWLRSMALVGLMGLTVWWCLASPQIAVGDASGVVMKLPAELDGYIGTRAEPDNVERELLPADTEFERMMYTTPTTNASIRDQLQCGIVLSGESRASIHPPEVCLDGQGWTLLKSEIRAVVMEDGKVLEVNDLWLERPVVLKSGEMRSLQAHYMYWFVGRDVTASTTAERRWLSVKDNLLRNVNHRWAYVSVMALVTENFTPLETGQRMRTNGQTVDLVMRVIRAVSPLIMKTYAREEPAVH